MLDIQVLWSAALSVILGVGGYFIREKFAEVKEVASELRRVERLLNITREENHRDFITKAEVQRISDHIDQRFNRLEEKIDQLIRQKGWMIMAGIDTLFKGAVSSLAKDKVTNTLTPTQMELASFILNPQYYIAEKGVNKIAEILGYGSDYKNLSADQKNDQALYKEVMRNTVGDMLPEFLGNIVRATPRVEEPYDPYNGYFAQNINDWVGTRESTPEKLDAFENTVRDMNYGTQTPGTGKYVGPLEEDNPIFDSNVSNLPYELKSTPVSGAPDDFDPALLAAIIRDANTTNTGATDDLGEVTIVDQKPAGNGSDLSYTDMLDVLNSTSTYNPNLGMNVPVTETASLAPVGSTYDANLGMNVPATESFAPIDFGGGMDYSDVLGGGYGDFGGGGSKGNIEDYSYSQYRYGGQIHRGRR